MSEQPIHKPETGDSTNHHQERRNVYTELKAGLETKKREAESSKQDVAWAQYAGYGEYYQKENTERAKSAKVKVDKYGGEAVTIIASINIDKESGQAISGHDYNPESQSMKDIESAWQEYLSTTLPEERMLIFEGDRVSPAEILDRDTAIRNRTESGLVQFLATQSNVEAFSGEPTNIEVAAELEKKGIAKTETALLFTLRSLAKHHGTEMLGDMKFNFYPQMQKLDYAGFEDFPRSDKELFRQDQNGEFIDNSKEAIARRQAINNEIVTKLLPYIDQWNDALRRYGLPEMIVTPDQQLVFAQTVSQDNLAKLANPAGHGELSEMFAETVKVRDKHIFETITSATQQGKKVFVVYGGSHVVSLAPVLQDYYKN